MTTVADVDLSTWNRYATSPRLRGSNPFGLNLISVGQASETNLAQSITDGDTTLARFFGYEHTSVSAISINSIVVASTSNEAPKALLASASNVSATGSRTLSSTALNPYQDLEYRWLLTYSDDSPIEDLEGIIDPRDSTAVNPYTDQISPEFTCIIREAGSYKLTLTARAMSSTYLQVVEQVATTTITVVEDTLNHLWYDGTSGNNANDGLDPWGFGLTTAVYTESTGELTQSGAFSSYVHDVSVPFTDRDNYIYISKAGVTGLYRIASKTDNNTIILEQKLGSDQTAVTSSNGAKQTFSGTLVSGTIQHLKGGNIYTVTNEMAIQAKANPVGVRGYGGKPTIQPSGISFLISTLASSSSFFPSYTAFSNITLDCNAISGGIEGVNTSTADSNTTTMVFDNCDIINSIRGACVVLQSFVTAPKVIHLLMYRMAIDNRYGTTGAATKGIAIYTSIPHEASNTRMFGLTLDNDSENSTLEHFVYPNGNMSHFHCAYTNFRHGNGSSSYCLNINNDEATTAKYISLNNNMANGNSDWFCDFSNSNNYADQKLFQDIVVINNKSNVAKAFTFHYSALDISFLYNEHWNAYNGHAAFSLSLGGGVFDPDTFFGVVSRNNVYGSPLADYQLGTTRELTDNVCYHTVNRVTLYYDPADLGAREFVVKDNNLYAPNKTSSTIISSDATDITLAAFNAATADIDGNTSTDPSWTDPANGSFNGTPLGLAVTVV